MNVYQKLNDARNAFHALKLEKTGNNKFAGYKYFELGDFLIPALKVFSEHGLTSIVSFGPDMAHMAIINTDDPKDSFQITSPMGSAALKGCHEVQNIGAVETYQRRYLWVSALEIVEHDALDASKPIDYPNVESNMIGDKQLENLVELANDVKANMPALLNHFKIKRIEDMPNLAYPVAMAMLEKKRSAV